MKITKFDDYLEKRFSAGEIKLIEDQALVELVRMAQSSLDNNIIPSHDEIKAVVKKNIIRVRALRESLGFSQEDLAKDLGISQAEYSQMEDVNGKLNKNLQLLKLLLG